MHNLIQKKVEKKTFIMLTGCLVLAISVVATLFTISNKIVHEPGSFLRVYQKAAAVKSTDLDIGLNSWYIAGFDEDKIYLGNLTAPLQLLIINHTLLDSQYVQIKLKRIEGLSFYKTAKVKIKPPYFYFIDGSTPCVFRGKIGDWTAERFMYDSAYFDQLEIIDSSSMAIRARNTNRELVLGKMQNATPHVILKSGLLEKQVDGIFCTDGMMRYNSDLKRLIYTYYYRNEYLMYDSNLKLDYRGHTLDTISRVQIKVAHISSNNNYILTQKIVTNQESCTAGNYLFIHSNVIAKNDFPGIFDKLSMIDVYDVKNKTYKLSFGLPDEEKGKKVRDFQVFRNRFLITLSGNSILRYDLQKKYF